LRCINIYKLARVEGRDIFGSKMEEVIRGCIKLLRNCMNRILRQILQDHHQTRRMRWERHVARKGEKRNSCRVEVGKTRSRKPLGRPRRRWECTTKMHLKEEK
jgi:predicted metallo-beta-lactamase superfamily hydrolase